jgi:curved DNA-binding protein CbpA
MTLTLPPDPYQLLGVSKDAKLPEIRSAHRKLVLKCHPDKVQDPTLKAAKQDEFQKVQQAYEILSDDSKRIQYDESVKLYELRKEMGRGNPTARSNPFEYEIKTAEPRPAYSRPIPRPDVYASYSPPRSHEDVYEIPLRTAKKSTSYEAADSRRRAPARDIERERRAKYDEDEKARERREKESKRSAHEDKKKSRDKEKRRGTEDKHSRVHPYVESDDEDYRATQAKKSSRHREDDIRMRPEEASRGAYKSPHVSPTGPSAPLTPKWENHKQFAAEYMMTANKKHAPQAPKEEFHVPPLRRAETYNVRNVAPQTYHISSNSDDDSPRRSSARTTRRGSEDPISRSSRDSRKDHKRSPSSRTREAHITIVEPASPIVQASLKIPKLHTHSSAPPLIPVQHTREKPSRSKTQDYPRPEHAMPPLPRAQTFQSGDRDHGRGREKGGSKLKTALNFDTDSDSDSPVYVSPRTSHSPQRRREAPPPEHKQTHTRYTVESGRTVPVASRHREDMRKLDDDSKYTRDRSPSPRSGRPVHNDRPPLARSGVSSNRQAPQRSQSQSYYSEAVPEVRTVRPERPKVSRNEHYFGEVTYAQPLTRENIVFSSHAPAEAFRRGSDPSHHSHRAYPDYPTSGRGVREAVYT